MALVNLGGRPLKYSDKDKLQADIDAYFADCDATIVRTIYSKSGDIIEQVSKPYTVSGLASYLGTSRETLVEYSEREGYADIIFRAKSKILAQLEEKAIANQHNATMTIFTLKNNYGYTDKTESENINRNLNTDLDATPDDLIAGQDLLKHLYKKRNEGKPNP